MSKTPPTLTLNNGVIMPAFGLGVFQSPPADTVRAVEAAIGSGYRMIDTAAAYFNEREVGEGIRRSGISRGELFVQTKLWISDYGYERALRAFDASLQRLGLDYVDSYLLRGCAVVPIHRPSIRNCSPFRLRSTTRNRLGERGSRDR